MVFDRTHPSFQHLQALAHGRLAIWRRADLGARQPAQRLGLLRYDDTQAVWVTVKARSVARPRHAAKRRDAKPASAPHGGR